MDSRVGASLGHVERLQPAGRVLGQQQPDVAAVASRPWRTGRRSRRPGQPGDRVGRADAELGGDGERGGGVGPVDPAGQLQADRVPGAGRVDHGVALDASTVDRAGAGRSRCTTSRSPERSMVRAALGAHPGVVVPALAGGDPGDQRRPVAPRAAQTTIGSSALATTWMSGCRAARPATAGHHRDLLGPVELVAAEVEQRDHARVGGVDDLAQVVLVDLEHRVRRVRRPWPAPRCARSACWRRGSWWRPSPSTPMAAAVSRVVVVLPLVPETSAIGAPGGEVAPAGPGRSSGRSSRRSPSRRRGRRPGTARRRSRHRGGDLGPQRHRPVRHARQVTAERSPPPLAVVRSTFLPLPAPRPATGCDRQVGIRCQT